MPYVMNLDMLLTVVASAYLYRKLKKTNDLFNTSKEIVAVGRFSIVAVGELLGHARRGCNMGLFVGAPRSVSSWRLANPNPPRFFF